MAFATTAAGVTAGSAAGARCSGPDAVVVVVRAPELHDRAVGRDAEQQRHAVAVQKKRQPREKKNRERDEHEDRHQRGDFLLHEQPVRGRQQHAVGERGGVALGKIPHAVFAGRTFQVAVLLVEPRQGEAFQQQGAPAARGEYFFHTRQESASAPAQREAREETAREPAPFVFRRGAQHRHQIHRHREPQRPAPEPVDRRRKRAQVVAEPCACLTPHDARRHQDAPRDRAEHQPHGHARRDSSQIVSPQNQHPCWPRGEKRERREHRQPEERHAGQVEVMDDVDEPRSDKTNRSCEAQEQARESIHGGDDRLPIGLRRRRFVEFHFARRDKGNHEVTQRRARVTGATYQTLRQPCPCVAVQG